MLAPIVLFVYKRADHTKQVIRALQKCSLSGESQLYIYSDGAGRDSDLQEVEEVREYIYQINGFKEVVVVAREKNYGLAQNILQGVSEVISRHNKVIVLEDDLVCSPYFLEYMNGALAHYEGHDHIFSVSAYNPDMKFPAYYDKPVYLNYRNSSWGWGTWLDRWEQVDWDVRDFTRFIRDENLCKAFNRGGEDLTRMLSRQMQGKLNSWSIRFTYAHFKQQTYSLCPVKSLIRSIGHDGSGTHSRMTNKFQVELDPDFRDISFPDSLTIDEQVMREFRKFYRLTLKKKIEEMIFTHY